MTRYRKGATAGVIVGAALVSLVWMMTPAQAQMVAPGGTYMQSCRDVRASGDAISALCRRADGSWQQSTLSDVAGCKEDIANMNSRLACARGGRQYGMGGPDYRQWGEGHGSTGSGPSTDPVRPQDYGPRYFRGYNMLYGYGR